MYINVQQLDSYRFCLTFYCRVGFWVALGLNLLGCISTPRGGQALPQFEQVMPAGKLESGPPFSDESLDKIESSGLAHFLRGVYHLKNQRLRLSAEELRLALIYFPNSAYLHQQLGRVWRMMGENSKSENTLLNGLKRNPSSSILNYEMGSVLHDGMQFSRSLEYIEQARKSRKYRWKAVPLWFSVQLWLGNSEAIEEESQLLMNQTQGESQVVLKSAQIFEEHGFYHRALRFYQKVASVPSFERAAAFGQMRVHLLLGNTSDAVDALIPLYANQANATALSGLISQVLAYGEHSEAYAYREEALRQAYGAEKSLIHLAFDDFASGRVEEALKLIDAILVVNPNSQIARLVAARMHANRAKYSECLGYLEKVGKQSREYNIQRALCWGGIGELESMLGEFSFAYGKGASLKKVVEGAAYWLARRLPYDKAMERFEAYCVELISHSLSKECVLGKAMIADFSGRGQVAIALMEEFQLLNDQTYSDWTIRLADLYCRYDRLDDGIVLLEELVRDQPNDLTRLNALGFRLVEANRAIEQASIWLHRAYRLAPQSGFVTDSLGWLFFRKGRYHEALTFVRMASFRNPNDPEILRHLGDIYLKLGRKREAANVFKDALSKDPSFALRKILRQRIERFNEDL